MPTDHSFPKPGCRKPRSKFTDEKSPKLKGSRHKQNLVNWEGLFKLSAKGAKILVGRYTTRTRTIHRIHPPSRDQNQKTNVPGSHLETISDKQKFQIKPETKWGSYQIGIGLTCIPPFDTTSFSYTMFHYPALRVHSFTKEFKSQSWFNFVHVNEGKDFPFKSRLLAYSPLAALIMMLQSLIPNLRLLSNWVVAPPLIFSEDS